MGKKKPGRPVRKGRRKSRGEQRAGARGTEMPSAFGDVPGAYDETLGKKASFSPQNKGDGAALNRFVQHENTLRSNKGDVSRGERHEDVYGSEEGCCCFKWLPCLGWCWSRMPNCPCTSLCGEDEKGNKRCPTLKLIAAIVIIIILLLIIILPLALTLGQDEEKPLASTVAPFLSSSTGQPPTPSEPSTDIKDPFPTLAKWRPDPPPVANCTSFGFQCLNGERVGTNQRCNGRMDCVDGSDELNCKKCETSFSCQLDSGDLLCVSADNLCGDGAASLCPRREDKDLYCSGECDLAVSYKCRGHERCIPTAWMCDGEQHCPEGDDEEGCKRRDCRHGSFWCAGSRRCLPSWFRCDGSRQCADGSDEVGCDCRGCSGKEVVLCAEPGGMCLRRAALCDGKKDCPGGQDEINCPGYCEAEAVIDKVLCKDGARVSLRQACSGLRPQCEDRCAECDPELAFACIDGKTPGRRKCIQRFQVCDGRPDCMDASDEQNCECGDGDWECPSAGKLMFPSAPKCIRASQRCDGYPDCPNNDDEMNCETCQVSVEGAVPVHCKKERMCYPSSARCDGDVQCGDYSDEDNCSCSACKSHEYQTFMCRANQRCLRQDYVCNPSSPFHCPGAMPEDEMYCQPDYDPLKP